MNMKNKRVSTLLRSVMTAMTVGLLCIGQLTLSSAQEKTIASHPPRSLGNPINIDYLQASLTKEIPRLFLNNELDTKLNQRVKNDPLVSAYMEILRSSAKEIMQAPLLERQIYDGRRMLSISREMVRRMGILGIVYHIDKDTVILNRIHQELLKVCAFSDWNPSHFLDVGEMALGVSIGFDFAGRDLPEETNDIVLQALIDKAARPGFDNNFNNWVSNSNNWNQVCHGGLIAAAISFAQKDPGLAADVISRALDNMHYALEEYGPDGVYPEGITYWSYGTIYALMTASILNNVFGTDFGMTDFPGFMESAEFALLMTAPSGEYFDFFDCQSNFRSGPRGVNQAAVARFNNPEVAVSMLWFATKTGNSLYVDRSYFLDHSAERRQSRFDGIAILWLTEFEEKYYEPLPSTWMGNGPNPIAIFRGNKANPDEDPDMFYLGTKGGRASISHGHMDAGSFIFELDGIRWSVDPGIQPYAPLEQVGFNQWNREQDSERWTLLTKGSHGHSTLVVNGQPHFVDGHVPVLMFHDGSDSLPSVTYNMTALFDGRLEHATRTFTKLDNRSVMIQDSFQMNENSHMMTWQMMTTADVLLVESGAVLRQDDKELKLDILAPANYNVSVQALSPPPLMLDKQITNLKRLEIHVPAHAFDSKTGEISIRLSGH
jgi:hypothetical protein